MTSLDTRSDFRLVPVHFDGMAADWPLPLSPELDRMIEATREFYAKVGYTPPWISYLSVFEGRAVGGGAFVGAPVDGSVEIAYFTLPEWQRQGHAHRTAGALVEIARHNSKGILVWAKTLPKEGPSTRVLERLGFRRTGLVKDDEVGQAWRWTLDADAR